MDSPGDSTFETLSTNLTIENLNSDNHSYLTINCDTGQHSQFLRCFPISVLCKNPLQTAQNNLFPDLQNPFFTAQQCFQLPFKFSVTVSITFLSCYYFFIIRNLRCGAAGTSSQATGSTGTRVRTTATIATTPTLPVR